MLNRLIPSAILTGAVFVTALPAQSVLVYDNGPVETSPGWSTLQFASLGLNVYGYGGQLTATVDNSCFDEFTVCQAMIVEEVEYLTYQTGGGPGASTITGSYIAFYDSDPSTQAPLTEMAGSPLITTDMFSTPNNPVTNAWSGINRDLDGNMATNRSLMTVRVRLEDAAGNATPLVLLPGTYWLERQSAGSLTSGPWLPPITCLNQLETGDAMQLIGATSVFNNPIVSGSSPQGMPFRLYGPPSSTPGTITQVANGCGQTGITVCGAPNVGGFIRTELTPSNAASGIPIIGYDFSAVPTPFCTCTAIHAFPIALWFATEAVIDIPNDSGFCGLTIGIQGAEFQGIGGCPSPPLNFTDGYEVILNM